MKALRLGELCAGYGGLGMAVEEVFNADTAWFSEFDAAPSKILAHHWPDVPNYGDMTKIDWAAIEPVDIISGGTPCQDLSAAGRRAGMTEGTRSNLWVQMREAIAIQKPKYVVWENVRGAYSASADSDLEQCPGCMGDTGNGGTVLRALGRVLGDISDLGYDTQWRGLRAADVGACHSRFRVFVLAQDRNGGRSRRGPALAGNGQASRADTEAIRADCGLSEPGPTPATPVADPICSRRSWGARKARRQSIIRAVAKRTGEGTGEATADTECLRGERRRIDGDLVGSTGTCEADGGERERNGDASDGGLATNWGEYKPAIRGWEARLGRPAPRPTEPTGRNNGHRLSPRFTEWMMGLPDGWVTDPAIGITRNEQLKACGNGVVPQQAMAALRDMLAAFQTVEVAA